MEEILRSICPLAQDQYGNYVVQVNVLVPEWVELYVWKGCEHEIVKLLE